jgi:3-oxoacyl-[acyl-carrier-protein] synthase II
MDDTASRVVISGIGVVSAGGVGKDPFWRNLKAGRSGIRKIEPSGADPYSSRMAGEVTDFSLTDFVKSKGLRHLSKSSRFVLGSAKLALDDARIGDDVSWSRETGLVIGTFWGSLQNMCQIDHTLITEGVHSILPSFFVNVLYNIPASQGSIKLNMTSLNTTLSSGFPSGLNAVGYACNMIRKGRVNKCLAGGVEEYCDELHQWMLLANMLSGCQNGGREFCAPLDAGRNGIVVGEGGAILFLESLESALARGARIYAEICGYGTAFEKGRTERFLPKKRGLQRSIRAALHDADMDFGQIDYVCANANAEVASDGVEAEVLQAFQNSGGNAFHVGSIKSMTGECFGASGPLQIAASALAVHEHIIPPTVNFKAHDPGITLNVVTDPHFDAEVNTALVNSFDQNNYSSLIVKKYSQDG